MKKILALALLMISCASVPPEAFDIRYINKSDPAKDCKELGQVYGDKSFFAQLFSKDYKTQMRGRAYKLGANLIREDYMERTLVYGTAFKCEKK